MSILIIAEHDNAALKSATAHAVTAAAKLGGDVHVLVAGHGARRRGAGRGGARRGRARCWSPTRPISPRRRRRTSPRRSLSLLPGQLHARRGGRHRLRQERGAAHRGQARRRADLGGDRDRVAGHVRAADLRGQCVRHRAVEGPGQGAHRAHHRVRQPPARAARRRSRAFRRRRTPGCRASPARRSPSPSGRSSPARASWSPAAARSAAADLQDARRPGGQAQCGDRRLARGGGRGLRAQRLPGRTDGQDRGAGPVHRRRHLRRDPAPGRA